MPQRAGPTATARRGSATLPGASWQRPSTPSPTRRSRLVAAWPSTRTPGTYLETPAEVDRLVTSTDPTRVGICLDVGHYIVGGGDPVLALQQLGDRVTHIHLKDVDPTVLARLSGGRLSGLGEAVDERIFTELGAGSLDLPGVLRTLDGRGYDGWLMVEQDSSWSPPSEAAAIGRRVLAQALAAVRLGNLTTDTRAEPRAPSGLHAAVIDRWTRRGLVSPWMTQVIWSCTSRRSDDRGRGQRPGPGNGSDRSCGCRRRRRKAHPNIFRRTLSVARTCRARRPDAPEVVGWNRSLRFLTLFMASALVLAACGNNGASTTPAASGPAATAAGSAPAGESPAASSAPPAPSPSPPCGAVASRSRSRRSLTRSTRRAAARRRTSPSARTTRRSSRPASPAATRRTSRSSPASASCAASPGTARSRRSRTSASIRPRSRRTTPRASSTSARSTTCSTRSWSSSTARARSGIDRTSSPRPA